MVFYFFPFFFSFARSLIEFGEEIAVAKLVAGSKRNLEKMIHLTRSGRQRVMYFRFFIFFATMISWHFFVFGR